MINIDTTKKKKKKPDQGIPTDNRAHSSLTRADAARDGIFSINKKVDFSMYQQVALDWIADQCIMLWCSKKGLLQEM